MKRLLLLSLFVFYTIPAQATTLSSPNYSITAGRIVSASNAATAAGAADPVAALAGSEIFTPASGISSPSYVSRTAAAVIAPEPMALRSGDINGDSVIGITDAVLALRAAVGSEILSAIQISRGDVAPLVAAVPVGNNRVDIEDAMLILRRVVALPW